MVNNLRPYEVRINHHISDFRTEVSTCKFPLHVCDCGITNNCIEEPFFSLSIMLRSNKSDRLETIKKHFLLKGCDAVNNPVRI